ncbi:MAG: hypothetical protein E7Z98_09580 [Olsenella sp.]|nr:hypothetical protein [Olsenella sp.]
MKFKYVRIQGRDLAANTMHAAGIFSMCVRLIQQGIMDEEDAALWREIDSWFATELPFPEPCMNKERVVCFFKTENTELMLKMLNPAMWLLERYEQPFFMVYTNTPGEIVYEDDYQIAVRVEDDIPIIEYHHEWTEPE